MLNEEMKLYCASGEFIHQIGNLLADDKIKICGLTAHDGKLLQELGHALRLEHYSSAGDFETLLTAGIDISNMSRTEIVNMADSIFNRAG